ncbi:hypothetical protein GC105_00195 [Alkalibaculum sp. M08DMB]|uniref:DUF4179 domain-containing protein n=1 Tax=Alkalibaculum sporogenes TaxID=2655001 RepID=A0A6A7K4A4_9FIRM|nr:DUF4179 domain-containing protein [Alkalibaculum sporogenes]MPW24218.1 hypothetical protein [Alkalibaculum sporogenes]
MFEEKYRSMNEQIFPDQKLVDKIIYSVNKSESGTMKRTKIFPNPIIIFTMLIVSAITITPVLAANVPAIYELMYFVSPTATQFFMPVQKSHEDNGIKMEVVSSYVHDNIVEVYITMQDLIGERIDETTDLNDSYSINRPFDSSATCQLIYYEESTRTATFLISITEWGNRNIIGDKITFSAREFISSKHEYNEIPIGISSANINSSPSTKQVSTVGGSGVKYEKHFTKYDNSAEVLVPTPPMDFPIKGIDLTGIGYVNDMLHIQTSVVNNLTKDNHGYFFLRDKNGNQIEYDYSVGFAENFDKDNRIDYNEFVFDIPQSEIKQYSFYGTFVTSGLFTEGNWQVTFPLEEIK